MSRVPDISREDLPEPKRHIWDEIAASRGTVRGPFKVMIQSPDLAQRAAHLGAYVRFESTLDPHVRELAAMTTAKLLECNYEYSAHVTQARAAGVSEATLEGVDQGHPDLLAPEDQWIYALTEQLINRHRIDAATFTTAQNLLGTPALVEMITTIGYYAMLAAPLNAFEVEPLPA